MKFTSIDGIVRSVLLQKNLPIHYYLQYAKYASDCYRELHFDTLRVVNARLLPVNDYSAIDLPCDYVDYVKVGIPAGQFVRPLHNSGSISRLNNLDAGGNKIKYGSTIASDIDMPPVVNVNDYQEYIGRVYGYNDGLLEDTFKVIPERNQIQLNENISVASIVLEYISDGTYADAATKVDPYAQSTIEAYMIWKASKNADIENSLEARTYFNQLRKLRARKNPMTAQDIKRVFNKHKTATIK